MKNKRTVTVLSLLAAIGIIAFFVLRVSQPISRSFRSGVGDFGAGRRSDTSPQKQSEDPWQAWVDKETDKTIKLMLAARKKHDRNVRPVEESQLAEWRTNIHINMTKHANMMKEKYPSPAAMEASGDGFSDEVKVEDVPSERYVGPQTVEALMEAFDEKYPRAEWLAILLDKGFMFGDFGDYSGLMSVRWVLVHFEENGQWRLGVKGVPHTDDWETFKDAYIDRVVWEEQQIQAARRIDPDVFGGLFTGPDGRTYRDVRIASTLKEAGNRHLFMVRPLLSYSRA